MERTNTDLVFNVAQLLKEQIGATRRFELSTDKLVLDDAYSQNGENAELVAHDLTGKVKVTKLKEGVLVQGDVEAQVTMECSRCLDIFRVSVDAGLEEQFEPTVDVDSGATVHRADSTESDGAFEIDPNHMMDLGEPVRQALLVALPMKPLCREDCKGICPDCGQNRNEAECGHTDEVVDERWAGLRALNLSDFETEDNRTN